MLPEVLESTPVDVCDIPLIPPWSNPHPGLNLEEFPASMPRSNRNAGGKLSAELADTTLDASEQFDQYGAELGKESLFWKVYVQETDKHDKEIVEKWHRQVDMNNKIGRSPGDSLFSAVLAAFLIESSKRLREDPAEASAQILRSMSETLWAVANNSPPPAVEAPQSKDAFSPSAAAVVVNTIWFSSLGLNVGTSFIAMLAKDWCHSFWADRHGPPCLQGRQRQRKWTMIERWGMRELIEMLPLLIHLSLFMFSVGLCIYVWDLHYPSAIPLILITLTAVVFYIASSITATFLGVELFPYTTIISRIMRYSKIYPWTIQRILRLAEWFSKKYPHLLGLLAKPIINWYSDDLLDSDEWDEAIFNRTETWFHEQKSKSEGRFKEYPNPRHDEITARALNWMIKNCKEPNHTDVALRAIAGATKGLSRDRLRTSNVALEISRRLVSGDLYGSCTDGERRRELYIRALSFLETHSKSGSKYGSHFKPRIEDKLLGRYREELAVIIWGLIAGSENETAKVIDRIADPFARNSENFDALEDGNKAASACLQICVKNPNHNTYTNSKELLASIVNRLQKHICAQSCGQLELHPAALLTLLNAATWLSACLPLSEQSPLLGNLCMKLIYRYALRSSREGGDIVPHCHELGMVTVICSLLSNKHSTYGRPDPSQPRCNGRMALQVLLGHQASSHGPQGSPTMVWAGLLEIASNPELYNIEASDDLTRIRQRAGRMVEKHLTPARGDNRLALQYLKVLLKVYKIVQAGAPPPLIYVFTLKCACNAEIVLGPPKLAKRIQKACGLLLSLMCFPRLSKDLVKCLEESKVIHDLVRCDSELPPQKAVARVATSQLWLLLHIAHHHTAPDDMKGHQLELVRQLTESMRPDSHADDALKQREHDLADKIERIFDSTTNPSTPDLAVRSAGNQHQGHTGPQGSSTSSPEQEEENTALFEDYFYRIREFMLMTHDRMSAAQQQTIDEKLKKIPPILREYTLFSDPGPDRQQPQPGGNESIRTGTVAQERH